MIHFSVRSVETTDRDYDENRYFDIVAEVEGQIFRVSHIMLREGENFKSTAGKAIQELGRTISLHAWWQEDVE